MMNVFKVKYFNNSETRNASSIQKHRISASLDINKEEFLPNRDNHPSKFLWQTVQNKTEEMYINKLFVKIVGETMPVVY